MGDIFLNIHTEMIYIPLGFFKCLFLKEFGKFGKLDDCRVVKDNKTQTTRYTISNTLHIYVHCTLYRTIKLKLLGIHTISNTLHIYVYSTLYSIKLSCQWVREFSISFRGVYFAE